MNEATPSQIAKAIGLNLVPQHRANLARHDSDTTLTGDTRRLLDLLARSPAGYPSR